MRTLTTAAQAAVAGQYAVEPVTLIEIEWTSPTDVPGVNAAATFWQPTDAPITEDHADSTPVELGLQFQSQTNGFIMGVRFYKASTNTGTHVAHLWDSTGTLLATATFMSETASGWQEVLFDAPVAISADTVYVASYHTASGHYSADQFYFSVPLQSIPLITTLQAGVFAYGSGTFPTSTSNESNYWVDVIFQSTLVLPPPVLVSSSTYSDQNIPGVTGKILALGGLDSIINETGQDLSQQLSVTLDDTDGTIKARIDSMDLHKRPVTVYQWIKGTTYPDDQYIMFQGLINSPLEWSEPDRTVKFSVVSRLENVEVGFFIEGGQFPDTDPSLIGKAWPLAFGTVINMPALQISRGVWGELLQGTGIEAVDLDCKLAAAKQGACPTVGFYGGVPMPDPSCAQNLCLSIASLELAQQQQQALETNPLTIKNGELFPQGVPVSIQINKAVYVGIFTGESFNVISRTHPDFTFSLPQMDTIPDSQCGQEVRLSYNGYGVPLVGSGQVGTGNYGPAMGNNYFCPEPLPVTISGFFWAEPGSIVTLQPSQPQIYILNIIPSTIIRVCARYTTEAGQLVLSTIPESYYTIRESDYGAYQMMELVLNKQLSLIDPRWQDDVFVTLTSDIGPNTVDILQWFIGKYTAFNCDTDSFAHVRALVDTYPSNFALFANKNIIDVLREISYQARCALWLRGDTFFIRYLAETPTTTDTITLSDVETKTLGLKHTQTEDLITKLTATWREDYSVEAPNTLILRNNIEKYGLQESSTEFYIYNQEDYVYKAASYWILRRSNIWRRAVFSTAMHKIAIEVLDAVSISLPQIAPGDMAVIVEKATYNWETNQIDFECWTPATVGTTVPYVFIYTANLDAESYIPDPVFTGIIPPAFRTLVPLITAVALAGLSTGASSACGGNPTTGFVGGEDGSPQTPVCQKDQPKKQPSDDNDEKEDPDTEGGAGGSPDSASSSAGSAATQTAATANQIMTNQFAQNANQAANAAAAAAGGGAGGAAPNQNAGGTGTKPSDSLKNLPQTCPQCGTIVAIDWFTTIQSESGGRQICVPSSGTTNETFCFGSAAAAQEFVAANGNGGGGQFGNCSGTPPCEVCGDMQITPGAGCTTSEGLMAHTNSNALSGDSIIDHTSTVA